MTDEARLAILAKLTRVQDALHPIRQGKAFDLCKEIECDLDALSNRLRELQRPSLR
jgi:hypothetical protein